MMAWYTIVPHGTPRAPQMYEMALKLSPGNTCAATHVAYGKRFQAHGGADEPTKGDSVGSEASADEEPVDSEAGDGSLDVISSVGVGLADLSVDVESPGALEAAARVWRQHGVVVFPSLLTAAVTDELRAAVRAAQSGTHTRDYTTVTRDKTHRVHKALPVSSSAAALDMVARKLKPFLSGESACPAARPHAPSSRHTRCVRCQAALRVMQLIAPPPAPSPHSRFGHV